MYAIQHKQLIQTISDLGTKLTFIQASLQLSDHRIIIHDSALPHLTARIGCSLGRRIGTQLTAKTQPHPAGMLCLQPA